MDILQTSYRVGTQFRHCDVALTVVRHKYGYIGYYGYPVAAVCHYLDNLGLIKELQVPVGVLQAYSTKKTVEELLANARA